jgi:hypothetical protein
VNEFYDVFEYDFNSGHGEVVLHKVHKDLVAVGRQIILVSIEGNRRREDYEGFGTIVTITAVEPAFNKDYIRVRTDLVDRNEA